MANDVDWIRLVAAGEAVRAPYPRAAMAPVDERDIAAVAARTLLDPRSGTAHELTGPQALTQVDRVRIIGTALRRPARLHEITHVQAREQLVRHLPPPAADFMLDQLAAAERRPALVCDTVSQITGRPARTYADWVAHRAAELGLVPA